MAIEGYEQVLVPALRPPTRLSGLQPWRAHGPAGRGAARTPASRRIPGCFRRRPWGAVTPRPGSWFCRAVRGVVVSGVPRPAPRCHLHHRQPATRGGNRVAFTGVGLLPHPQPFHVPLESGAVHDRRVRRIKILGHQRLLGTASSRQEITPLIRSIAANPRLRRRPGRSRGRKRSSEGVGRIRGVGAPHLATGLVNGLNAHLQGKSCANSWATRTAVAPKARGRAIGAAAVRTARLKGTRQRGAAADAYRRWPVAGLSCGQGRLSARPIARRVRPAADRSAPAHGPADRAAAPRAPVHQGTGPPSSKRPPVGPSSGRVASRIATCAPSSAVRVPLKPFRSVAT